MTSLKLDRSRHFNQTSPPAPSPEGRIAHFSQDGFYFDVEGNIIDGMMSAEDRARYQQMKIEMEAERKADEARRKAFAEAGIDPDSVTYKTVRAESNEPDHVDLRQWVMRKQRYPWARVRDAIREKYQFVATSGDAARRFLVEDRGYEPPPSDDDVND